MSRVVSTAVDMINAVREAGWESWIVGGAVRDTLMKKEPADVDIVSSAGEAVWQKLFGRTVRVGRRHNTFLVFSGRIPFEVTPLKGATIEEDLSRRDFSCNAAAFDSKGALIDPFGAERAVTEKRLAAPGDPSVMFQQDKLRLLRMIRFEICLGFKADDLLERAFQVHAHSFFAVPERIQKELDTIRACISSSKLLGAYEQRAASLPESFRFSYNPQHREFVDYPLSALAWSLMLTDGDDKKGRELGFGRRLRKMTGKAADAANTYPWSNEALYYYGKEAAVAAAELLPEKNGAALTERRYQLLPIKHRRELALNGEDISLFAASDRKAVLEACERYVLQGGKNERESLLRYAKERQMEWEQRKH
ncbi:hypothetical protein [Alkalicoccus luteus]|uniref:hypothetical protein n=1 Tax=Alkalicoccus luteus TaxID=1237094 RepID=UPI00403495A7